jgi:hypothetical protein
MLLIGLLDIRKFFVSLFRPVACLRYRRLYTFSFFPFVLFPGISSFCVVFLTPKFESLFLRNSSPNLLKWIQIKYGVKYLHLTFWEVPDINLYR